MIRLITMSIPDLLNKKFLEWQLAQNKRRTVEDFAALFGVSQTLMTMWMNGKRTPGPKYKEKLIEMYGDEAIEALGEDPDLYAIQQDWEYLSPEQRRQHRKAVQEQASKNDTKRTSEKRRTATP